MAWCFLNLKISRAYKTYIFNKCLSIASKIVFCFFFTCLENLEIADAALSVYLYLKPSPET